MSDCTMTVFDADGERRVAPGDWFYERAVAKSWRITAVRGRRVWVMDINLATASFLCRSDLDLSAGTPEEQT